MTEMFKMFQAQNERLERQLQQQNREPLGAMADTLIKLDQLRGGQKELPADVIMRAIELGKSVGGGSGEGDFTLKILDLLKESLPTIKGLIGSFASRNGGAATTEAVVNDEEMLKVGLTYLKKKALAGSDPALYVHVIVDNRDETLYDKLIHRILESDFSAFAAIDADISRPEYEPFFRSIYNGIRSVFIESSAVEVDTVREGGDAGNLASDGKSRKGSGKKS
jgi:hypothetical protein